MVGTALVLVSVGFFLGRNLFAGWALGQNADIAVRIGQILPARSAGIEDDRANTDMSVLQFEGKDYVCLLEVPAFDVCLPVQSQWDAKELVYGPCRFWGSCYDGTMILGGSGLKGQFDFCQQLDLDDLVVITDMEGTEFTYHVERIDRSQTVPFEKLSDSSYSLTLFVREAYSTDYIIVRCNMVL